MRRKFFQRFFIALAAVALSSAVASASRAAKGGEFGDVVKLIESHYRVKHKGMSLAAKVGMKAGQMVARRLTNYSEYGSAKFVYFEDQDFTAAPGGADFFAAMRGELEPLWQPLVQVRAQKDGEQSYVYTREAGKFFRVLVVTIDRRDATVVQVDLAPQKLWLLMRDPDSMGKTLTDEAASDTTQD